MQVSLRERDFDVVFSEGSINFHVQAVSDCAVKLRCSHVASQFEVQRTLAERREDNHRHGIAQDIRVGGGNLVQQPSRQFRIRAVLKSVGPVLLPEFLPDFVLAGDSVVATVDATSTEADSLVDESGNSPESPESAPPSRDGDSASVPARSDWDSFVAEQLSAGSRSIYDDAVQLAEKQVIARILRHTDGNQVKASELLGITRTTLRNKIKQHGITIGRSVE